MQDKLESMFLSSYKNLTKDKLFFEYRIEFIFSAQTRYRWLLLLTSSLL